MTTLPLKSAISTPHAGLVRRGLRVIISTLVVAAAAHIAFPLPFTPVPFSLQPLAVLAVGLALGPVDGFFAMLTYLAEGAAGLPVFSPTGPGGFLQLLGPTGGYLLSYPLVAMIAGGLTVKLLKGTSPFVAASLACLAATLLLFLTGAGWLAQITHLSLPQAWRAGVLPFLPGEAIKIVSAAGAYAALRRPSPSTQDLQ